MQYNIQFGLLLRNTHSIRNTHFSSLFSINRKRYQMVINFRKSMLKTFYDFLKVIICSKFIIYSICNKLWDSLCFACDFC